MSIIDDEMPNVPSRADWSEEGQAAVARFDHAYILGTGAFLPGPPISNAEIDDFIAPIGSGVARIKRRVLRENGINTRHYALDRNGETVYSSWQLAEIAVRTSLDASGVGPGQVSLLCTGSSGGDTGMPGFANMLHGNLGFPPLEASSHQGVCAAGMQALKYAASAVELGHHHHAVVATSEMPSRLFKHTRFEPAGRNADFDAHFLRWMLSDGAGAMVVGREPTGPGPALKIQWIHSRSFSGDFPVCMQIGYTGVRGRNDSAKSYLDYPSLAEAERAGAFLLRQDLRLLPNLFEVGVHEYASLADRGYFVPEEIDHFLCHYSSEKFSPVVDRLMNDAGLAIPKERWYSNLSRRGNTGAASIFIMLADFVREHALQPGEQILCFVPESGRFSVASMLLEVVEAGGGECGADRSAGRGPAPAHRVTETAHVHPPHVATKADQSPRAQLLRSLSSHWHQYRSQAWRTPLVRRILSGSLTRREYLSWMASWIPQVREGSIWMRSAAANIEPPFTALTPLVQAAAADEQLDYTILFDDYQRAGGSVNEMDALTRNPGGEALNAYLHARAGEKNPVGLLGAMYIIEGTGQRIIPHLLPHLRACSEIPHDAFRFLSYHAENDIAHLERWLQAVELALAADDDRGVAAAISNTASDTARLYLMQIRMSIE